MEPEGSLPHPQEPATCPYPEQSHHIIMPNWNFSASGQKSKFMAKSHKIMSSNLQYKNSWKVQAVIF